MSPLVSVVIPTYNMVQYLGAAIRSVLQGCFEDLEVIVVDDGSTDSTQRVVERFIDPKSSSYDSRVAYAYQPNKGKASAVNVAFHEAKGEYVTILDADDELTPGSLATRWVACNAEAQMVVGGTEVFEKGQPNGYRKAPRTTDPNALRRRFFVSYKTPFLLNACLVSHKIIRKVGPLDTRLRRCQDIDYAMRLLEHTQDVAVVDEPVYRYRKHRETSSSRIRLRGKTGMYRALALWKNAPGPLKLGAVFYGVAMDFAKAIYEIFGSYKH